MNLTEQVMSSIRSGQAKMRPKWHFVVGSAALVAGLTGLAILAAFAVSLIAFSLRTHGPMGEFRYERLLSTFPWGAVVVAIAGSGLGAWLLKKYDFSYKKNFPLVVGGAAVAILLAGWLINVSGLDSAWMKRGPMKPLYERYQGDYIPGHGWRSMQGERPMPGMRGR